MARIPNTPKRPKARPQASRRRASMVSVMALIAGIATISVISGCAADNRAVVRGLEIIGLDEITLSEEARSEIGRFEDSYKTLAPETGPDDIDRFRHAYRRVQAAYVSEVSGAELVDAAIKGLADPAEPGAAFQGGGVTPGGDGGAARGPQPAPKPPIEAALNAMLQSLDPHSDYLSVEERTEALERIRGEFGGLGIVVTRDEDVIKVVSPIEDTPAARAGMKTGDLITHVDGVSIHGKTLSDAVSAMRGPPDTKITLRVRRDGAGDFDLTLTRAIIKVKAVRWRQEGDIGYIRVSSFTDKVTEGVVRAMVELRNSPTPLKGLIIDLRSNPGGALNQSVLLADSFLDQGEIVSVRGRLPEESRRYVASEGDLAGGLPIVVLVDKGSASAAEIVASALQFHGRAVVMGTKSFGKGSVQTILPLPDGAALKLTTALYYSPSGRTIQALGVSPNIFIDPENRDELPSEVDLPGAIPAQSKAIKDLGVEGRPHVAEKNCPEAGEEKDRVLGCALAFLKAGSQAKFLAAIKGKPAT